MEISVYIMRTDEEGVVYRGYQARIESGLLEGEYIYPIDDGIGIACGEDAVVMGRTLNRAVYDRNGNFKTVLAGDLVAVRYDGKCFSDIQKEDIIFIEKLLKPIGRIAYGKVFLKETSKLPEWSDR